jgi:thymidylate synthase (FAD)
MNDYEKIDVLDHGFVRAIEIMGTDLTVVNAARVSFHKESEWEHPDSHVPANILSEKDKKLIKYLAVHKHWTPFAHPQIMLHIKAPVSIRTQLFKHKVGFVENEISRRYVTEEPEIYIPKWRSKPTNGAKQGSEDFIVSEDTVAAAEAMYFGVASDALKTYNWLIEAGVAPEQARFVLPQGTYTEWYWTGSLAAYARVYKQRIDPHAQWEVRQYAEAIGKIIAPYFEVSWEQLTRF